MHRSPLTSRLLYAGIGCLLAAPVLADMRVAVVAKSNPEYTARKFAGGKPRKESYVFMQGNYFDGKTRDKSIEKMPFQRILEYLAPELAKQQYFPAPSPRAADLLIVVHWGTTRPYASIQEMSGRTSITTDISVSLDNLNREIRLELSKMGDEDPGNDDFITQRILDVGNVQEDQLFEDRLTQFNDEVSSELSRASNVSLLGYNNDLLRYSHNLWPTEAERAARYELADERYFIILMAYDLPARSQPGASRRPLWTMHLNMSSPGINFPGALTRMSAVAQDFFGRTTLDVTRVRPGDRTGKVTLAPLEIIGEASPGATHRQETGKPPR